MMVDKRIRLAFLRWVLPKINPAAKELREAVSETISELEEEVRMK